MTLFYWGKGFITESHYEGVKKMYFLLVSRNGEILAKSDLKHWSGIQAGENIVSGVKKSGSFRTVNIPGKEISVEAVL